MWSLLRRESFLRRPRSSESGQATVGNCKPISLRSSFSVVSLLYVLALIGGLEYCFRTFPAAENRRAIPNGTDSEIYGPFNSAPLNRVATVTQAPTTRSSQLLNISTISSEHKILTPTQMTTLLITTSTNIPNNWEDPSTGLPGHVQYVQFDVLGVKNDNYNGCIWAYIEYHFDSKEEGWFKDIKDSHDWCPIVCDGLALVFLKEYCWDSWKDKASLYARRTALSPLATVAQSEDEYQEGTRCPAVARAVVTTSSPATAVTTSNNVVIKTTSIDTEVIQVTTVSGVPSTFTRSTRVPIPVTVEAGPRASEAATQPNGEPTAGLPTPTMGGADQWTFTTTVQRDAQGRPTATVTARLRASKTTITLMDSNGLPTATVTTNVLLVPSLVTMTGSDGVPTATITTNLLAAAPSSSLVTFRGVDGIMTTTLVPIVPGQVLTLTDSNGVPVATITGYGRTPTLIASPNPDPIIPGTNTCGQSADSIGPDLHPISWRDYLLASFAPILITLPLAILVQIQSASLKALLPYYSLSRNRPEGHGWSTAAESLCLVTGGPRGIVNSVRLLFSSGEPLAFLADLHVLTSSLVISFSSEALGIKLYGYCQPNDFRGCHMGVALFKSPTRIVQAILVLSLVISVVNSVLLHKRDWRRAVTIYSR
ncbi:hypothetical protein B0H66DRAFT_532290 [Apodospora peruviana]|uniref:Uncharacterized protein n=1 Tax=Apodospora peruviana TaxID=516989 RepID=A0AAE0IDJ1_9PEZI|nr:hypothetical protein B0H66DRAFT_532290 [Apodospora peruviana]